MKKIIALILSLVLCITLVGCASSGSELSQTMTLVRMPSPPKCKTFDDIGQIDKVLSVLNQIEKGDVLTEDVNGWVYFIKLNVDGTELCYSIGGVFTDADGRQYEVLNFEEIKSKLDDIYGQIDAEETDYK